jgi:hypothetical protein
MLGIDCLMQEVTKLLLRSYSPEIEERRKRKTEYKKASSSENEPYPFRKKYPWPGLEPGYPCTILVLTLYARLGSLSKDIH